MSEQVLKGKKLLILAGGPNLVTLVKRARYLGIHTIVTDYYDLDTSPAKKIADEYWDISWSDIDQLERKCREEHVNGITTGYSETPVEACIELCERLQLPCYCTREQLEFTRDKVRFKEVCRKNGVPTVQEFKSIEDVNDGDFPVIVKPVDRAGSIGVGIAGNQKELYKVYEYAMEMSYCKQVIIEKYISGTKIDAYYEIREGQITLLTTDDVINAADNGYERVVQSSWLLPSRVHTLILEKADDAFRRLLRFLKIRNGYIFFSGFEYEGEVMFFEAGFRLCGGHWYEYLQKKGMVNNLDIFIYHALTGRTDNIPVLGEVNETLKCVDINIYAKEGTIAEIEGLEEIAAMEDCCFTLLTGHVGQVCKADKAILDKIAMFYFCSESPKQLQEDVKQAYALLKINGVNGEDMIYDRIDPEVISSWWENKQEEKSDEL